MKLTGLMSKPLSSTLTDMEVAKLNPIANDKGEVIKVIVEYVPKETPKSLPDASWMSDYLQQDSRK